MIPLRVYLKNFLCHTEQEFRFDDHPVWLLHGPNGVGKSAVFDGMLYALYGKSQRSDDRKNAVSDVIRHGESSMRVEFDFEVSAQRYRVWRTRVRNGQPKQGVYRWHDGQWPPIRDVNAVDDLEDWVERTIGLNYDAFVSAVLLRQGAAEKLIDADKETRRQLFRSFIDLDPYIELHDRVTEARAGLFSEARVLRMRFERMPNISDDQLADAAAEEQLAAQKLQTVRAEENAARNRLGHARTWEQNEKSRRQIQAQLDAAAARMRNAAVIEKSVSRLKMLRELVPSLKLVGQLQRSLADAEKRFSKTLDNQAAATTRHSEDTRKLEQVRFTIGTLRDQVREFDRQILVGESEQKHLSEEIDRAKKAADLHSQLAKLRAKKFDTNLDKQFCEAEQSVIVAQSARDAAPHLDVLATRRTVYHEAVANEQKSAQDLVLAVAEFERLQLAVSEVLAKLNAATSFKSETDHAATVAKEQRKQALKQRDHFANAANKPVCLECRQPIDATHAAKERGKLESAVTQAEANLKNCAKDAAAADTQAQTLQNQHQVLTAEHRAAEQNRDESKRSRDDFHRRAAEAKSAFEQALKALAEPFPARVAVIAAEGFPTVADVADVRRTAAGLSAGVKRRDLVRTQVTDRDRTQGEIQLLEQSVAAVGAPPDVTAARATHAQVEIALRDLRSKRADDDQSRLAAEKSELEIASELKKDDKLLTQMVGDVGRCEAEVESTRTQLDEAVVDVPDSHRSAALTTTEDEIQVLAEELEETEESQVEAQFAALADDRALQADRQRQFAEIEERIAQIPEDARRPATQVEGEVLAAAANTRAAEQADEIARTKARVLSDQQNSRRETEQQLDETEKKHALHDQLAVMLGQDGIQLDLVRAEESQIITRANEILLRLSLGELRLEPPGAESKRAFDLSVRRSGCPQPITVANLSGGQRFRTAISLALAVSQGTNDVARRLESVIIDEGFGSLDRDGRQAMVAELRDGQYLAQMFKKIIVVSHQEDFAAAFPVGYRFWTENASTRTEPFGLR